MKGEDEIRKALALCPGDSLECEQDGCPFWDIRLCVPELHIDALELLKEREAVVRCKDCKRVETCCRRRTNDPNWFCADGERKEGR